MADKHPGGRPPKFESVEQMQEAIDKYFADLQEDEYVTVSGLALALDMTRQTLCNYEHKDEFFYTIKKAKLRAEHAIEQRLMSGQATVGAIFNLKNNFDWKDKVEQHNTGTVGGDWSVTFKNPTHAGTDSQS